MSLLSDALSKAKSITDLNDIFAHEVDVQIGCMNDIVTVDGYEGSVTTDAIAQKVMRSSPEWETDDSTQLATYLAEKVFTPLRNLVEAPKNRCAAYQIVALTRIGWTPPPAPQFGKSIALKHAMVLGMLDSKYGGLVRRKEN